MADAWHHRSDALSSVGSFAGILGARMGYPVLDPAASVVICCFILKAAADIFIDAVCKMIDEACDPAITKKIEALIVEQEGVLGLDILQTRRFGERIYVDVEIRADGNLTLTEAHKTAEQVHDRIEEAFPMVKHCMVHVNPAKRDRIS
jgi:cation diffusion facilitator family transporter